MHDNIKQSLKVVHFTALGIITVLLACTVAFGILPMYQRGKVNIKNAADLRNSIERLEQLKLANARAEIQLRQSEARLKDAEQHLASGPPDNAFNRELTQVAQSAGIRIENMPPLGPAKDAGAYKTVQVTVIGSGDWESCYKFLAGLRSMDRILRLDTVVLDTQDKEPKSQVSDKVLCQLTVKFSTFYMER
jgi:Tfp pilus assembly protein PilO